jgi:hypothetical protein
MDSVAYAAPTSTTDYLFQKGHYARSIDFVAGVNWNQPVQAPGAKPALGNRFGLSFETRGITVGKAGHLPISIGMLYSTRAAGYDGAFNRGTFSLLQMPILGHGAIRGLPWLEAAAGITPGVVLDHVTASDGQGYHADNDALGNRLNCDITVGVAINLYTLQLRALLYQSPVSNLEGSDMMFSGFIFDLHLPLRFKRKPQP